MKDWRSWKQQSAGLQTPFLPEEGIFGVIDFLFSNQRNVISGHLCPYLQPVYTSLMCVGEHWIFIVLETFDQNQIESCMNDLLGTDGVPLKSALDTMLEYIVHDLTFLAHFLQEVDPGNVINDLE